MHAQFCGAGAACVEQHRREQEEKRNDSSLTLTLTEDVTGYGAGEVLMMKTEEEKGRRGASITTGRRRTVGSVK